MPSYFFDQDYWLLLILVERKSCQIPYIWRQDHFGPERISFCGNGVSSSCTGCDRLRHSLLWTTTHFLRTKVWRIQWTAQIPTTRQSGISTALAREAKRIGRRRRRPGGTWNGRSHASYDGQRRHFWSRLAGNNKNNIEAYCVFALRASE